ncbi:MAG: bifunctional phosphopantothenoylcysteine decarboxylase/phosphopantothenate--cysteine ligase CoaBC [Candidatus Goldbacteria bacterium]|nr:bifunctional phosphopantothenoylcysteine decarboxylase/phosphopantothenate--cysteine ligase CoaBC [Candidatus Goldiibacteriota bacterium]
MIKKKSSSILLGITGSIAAYKACDLVRIFRELDFTVFCVMTACAEKFITPLTLKTLSCNPVFTDMFFDAKNPGASTIHIDLAKDCDVILVAPATANIIGKVASGIADDLLSTVIMATDKKVIFAPAMNTNMWNNKIVQENVDKLKKAGYLFVGPKKGKLACGDYGEGHIAEIEEIKNAVLSVIKKKTLDDKTFLITSGPTREYIDAVRFISNPSSGKTGFFLAEEAKSRGAEVIFITGESNYIPDADIIEKVQSAEEMLIKVKKYFKKADVVIGAAAVGDFTPIGKNTNYKISRKNTLKIQLRPTKDILAEIGKNKGKKILVGFSAETGNSLDRTREKIKNKNLDLIIFNDISKKGVGFGSDENEIKIINRKGDILFEGIDTKKNLAVKIIDTIEQLL